MIETARRVAAAGLVTHSSGNLSRRLDDDRFEVTASGALLGELRDEQIATCSISDPDLVEGPKPSLETPLHRAIYGSRADVGAVLHFQSPSATALACAEESELDLNFIPEIPAYIDRIGLVPYQHPGTGELAAAVGRAAAAGADLIVLRSHGQIALGRDLDDVFRKAWFFEFGCNVLCQGIPLVRYGDETVARLRQYGS